MKRIEGRYCGGEWEEIDTCSPADLDYLMGEYRLAFGRGWEFRVVDER